ncbi:uncharacterized protein ASPGLDRAFT_164182 [Aspergillus glaucus CBS 516.65]|uniref:Uncharacterized protein n=1 Tax=Aspergillus glaucus CBS 516.65 TaxID=1160497 RepID=A0A1L9VUZ1_ASPGL|nr:hypothetical protein ASPGLDRAFT_164182 [Aspergillus glaucus CBS 516.65]OJJ87733.1 hypothetical protein ASPGLDRAFT_164182 [Aspergillus glaucus CBS 516.65]
MSEPLLVPIQLDAFVLNPAVCGDPNKPESRICPITQPNYTFLRYEDFVAESDVQPHADLHNAAPADHNSRMTDLGTGQYRRNRHGVYIHWSLPRAYRAGVSLTDSVGDKSRRDQERQRHGLGRETDDARPSAAAEYIDPPTRWLVVRKLDLDTIQPVEAKENFEEYTAWVIEGDYLWKLDDIPAHYDLQVDVSPFLAGDPDKEVDVRAQAEVFIGRKTPLKKWLDDAPKNPPRIPLLGSGNQLFADFQQHNSNVFSMVDNFSYGDETSPQYLDVAEASYYVIGWHRNDEADPLWMENDPPPRAERLNSLFMSLQGNEKAWLDATGPARLLCHGAMYSVQWDWNKKPKTPADEFARRLQDQNNPAVSVGTTALDSLMTYCKARRGDGGDFDTATKLEKLILAVQVLLHTNDDGVEGQREAIDTLYNWNFTRSPGGIRYFLATSDDAQAKPLQIDDTSQTNLKTLNQHQILKESCLRVVDQLRWDMFALWWKYITDPSNTNGSKQQQFKSDILEIRDRIVNIGGKIKLLEREIKGLKSTENVRSGTHQPYHQARDPTLLLGGIDQGWPSDYLSPLSVRLKMQTISSTEDEPIPDGLESVFNQIKARLASSMSQHMLEAARNLFREFYFLIPPSERQPSPGKYYPQFHDKVDECWRDQWNQRQPWRPLYMEWEAEYIHIPFEHWSLGEQAARLSENNQIRYGVKIDSGAPLWEELTKPSEGGKPSTLDRRLISGRGLILPQPSFSLDARVRQLFSTIPEQELDDHITEEERKYLLEHIPRMPYLSGPLSGLTDGLLTLAHGTHIKPLARTIGPEGERMTAIKSACVLQAGFDDKALEMIQGHSALTPLAATVAWPDQTHCPFKPVTHGQVRFRKLNIIDKFGQTLVAIDPEPRTTGPPPLYPCISDFYEPQKANDQDANTVLQEPDGNCQFFQIPPQIGQNSRLNACFVTRNEPDTSTNEKKAYWRPTTEWENPIWGWVVTNYADEGIQFFLPDGTFYSEVRVGGHLETVKTPKWMPFKPDPSAEVHNDPNRKKFDALIEKLSDIDYLRAFWYMVVNALDSLPPTPNSYAQYLTAIVGKPLALVNMGWSLELDRPPLQNQATNTMMKEPSPSLSNRPDKQYYELQVKLGDKEREYDGMVGYFNLTKTEDASEGEELNLDIIQTYFATPDNKFPSLKAITSETHPKFRPFWESPWKTDPPSGSDFCNPADYDNRRNSHLKVFGALVDPFTPIHAYSSFLPAQSLQLAPWTWQEAMSKVTAFFHAGPITLTADVKEYDPTRALTQENMNEDPPHQVGLPGLGGGKWSWLQPYVDPSDGLSTENQDTDSGDSDAGADLHSQSSSDSAGMTPPIFNSYGIGQTEKRLAKPGFESGPYTAIEGFLHLRRPIMMDQPEQEGEQGEPQVEEIGIQEPSEGHE